MKDHNIEFGSNGPPQLQRKFMSVNSFLFSSQWDLFLDWILWFIISGFGAITQDKQPRHIGPMFWKTIPIANTNYQLPSSAPSLNLFPNCSTTSYRRSLWILCTFVLQITRDIYLTSFLLIKWFYYFMDGMGTDCIVIIFSLTREKTYLAVLLKIRIHAFEGKWVGAISCRLET